MEKTVYIILKNGLPLVSFDFFGHSKHIGIYETRKQAEDMIATYYSDTRLGSAKMTVKGMKAYVP